MRQTYKRPMVAVLCSAMLVLMAGCREEGPAERAGKEIDKAAEQVGNSLQKLGDDVKKATQ